MSFYETDPELLKVVIDTTSFTNNPVCGDLTLNVSYPDEVEGDGFVSYEYLTQQLIEVVFSPINDP